MPGSVAEIEITAATGGLAAGLNNAARMLGGFANTSSSVLGSVTKSIASIGARAIGHFAGAMATRGLDFVVEQGQNVLKFEEALTRLGLASRKSGVELRAIGDSARALSTATGLDAIEVLRGARAYIDLAGAEAYTSEKMSLIARTSQAAGADIGDVATVVYSLTNALQIAGPELEDTIGGLLNQSKSGAIHFSQMASEMVSLAPSFAQFGIKGREGAIRLGAALQIVRTGFGSASEAGTGLQRLLRSLPQHANLFEKGGVQIFKKGSRSELLTLDQIMENIYKSKLRLDRPALIKAFGRGEAERAFQLFQGSGVDENGKIVDNIEKYHELIEQGRVNGTVQADTATIVESSSGKIATAVEKMKNAVAVAFNPERVAQFAETLTRASEAFMTAAHWIDSHIDVSDSQARETNTGYLYDKENSQIIHDNIGNHGRAAVAAQLQNFRLSSQYSDNGLSHSSMVNIREALIPPGMDYDDPEAVRRVESMVHDVGKRLGAKVPGGISFGSMVHDDEDRAAGEKYLKGMGVVVPGSETAKKDAQAAALKTWSDTSPAEQQRAIGAAVRDALGPSLTQLARALGERAPAINLDGAPIARSVENSPTRRTRP